MMERNLYEQQYVWKQTLTERQQCKGSALGRSRCHTGRCHRRARSAGQPARGQSCGSCRGNAAVRSSEVSWSGVWLPVPCCDSRLGLPRTPLQGRALRELPRVSAGRTGCHRGRDGMGCAVESTAPGRVCATKQLKKRESASQKRNYCR